MGDGVGSYGIQGHSIHNQQQKLAALLSSALPKEDHSATSSASNSASSVASSSDEDPARVSALNSLHRVVSHPHNALLVARSVSFLCPALFKLLADKSFAVRQAAVSVCACVCAITSHPSYNACPSPSMVGSPADRFIGWALPQFSETSGDKRSIELALIGLNEFFGLGDVNSIERYSIHVLRACQDLLEDERMSLDLLRPLLNLLVTLAVKFTRQFQPHFADIVDLLLGSALMPELSDADRCLITNSFLQFQKLWLGDLKFSFKLLTKFLGDMEAVVDQNETPTTPEQLQRFLALVACFVSVLQATASGVLEVNLIEHIIDPLQEMLQRLLTRLSMAIQKFGSIRWLKELSRCLTLFANILKERFANFYPSAVGILLQSLQANRSVLGMKVLSSQQIQMLLKSNLQLMSVQRSALLPSAIQKIVKTDSPFAMLRLHPNQLVTSVVVATYLFLLKHDSNDIVDQAINSLKEELEKLKIFLLNFLSERVHEDINLHVRSASKRDSNSFENVLSESDVLTLIKFDLMILRISFVETSKINVNATEIKRRAKDLSIFMIERLNPFRSPFQFYVELQHSTIQIIHRIFNLFVFGNCNIAEKLSKRKLAFYERVGQSEVSGTNKTVSKNLNLYGQTIANALHATTAMSVQIEALDWIRSLCKGVIMITNSDAIQLGCYQSCEDFRSCWHTGLTNNILFPVLCATGSKETKIRLQAASVIELLLQAELVDPMYFDAVINVAFERLGDSEPALQNTFRKVLASVAPSALYLGSWLKHCEYCCNNHIMFHSQFGLTKYMPWKQIFNLKHGSQSFRSQQLVCVLNYMSQRGQVLSSSWLQRLIMSHLGNLRSGTSKIQIDDTNSESAGLSFDSFKECEILETISSTNNLAAAWWAVHEAARNCICVRLRTHLGGPTQTFAALERMLLDIAQIIEVDPVQRESNSGMISSGNRLLAMRLLLEFVESLKRQIYNAYEGSVVLPSAPTNSALFFRANKKVCEEWFARICEAMMNASSAIHCDSGTYYHAATRLHDLRNALGSTLRDPRIQGPDNAHTIRSKILNDVLRILRHASLALCRLHEPDAILGLQRWAMSTFGFLSLDDNGVGPNPTESHGLLGWMTGLFYQAKGQYEKATAHFTQMLQSEEALTSMGADGVQFVIARLIDSYVALADWESLDQWLQELQVLRAKHAGKSYAGALTTAGNETNAIHALACFDGGDVRSAWGYLDLTPQSSSELTVDPRLALHRSEQMLLQAMLRPNSEENEIRLDLGKAKAMLEEALLVSSIDGFPEAAEYVIQFCCALAFEYGRKLHHAGQDDCSEFASLISFTNQVINLPINSIQRHSLLWLKILRVYNVVLPESKLSLQLCHQLIRLARKQTNFQLAHCLDKKLSNDILKIPNDSFSHSISVKLHYERILLSFAEGEKEEAFLQLWSLVHPYIQVAGVGSDPNNILNAKACIKLSDWLKERGSDIDWANVIPKMSLDTSKFVSREAVAYSDDRSSSNDANWMSAPRYNLILDEVCGASIKTASLMCPTMSKAWFYYASWCFSQAKGALSQNNGPLSSCNLFSVLKEEISLKEAGFSSEEVLRIRAICMQALVNDDIKISVEKEEVLFLSGSKESQNIDGMDSIERVVQRIVFLMQVASGAPGAENIDGESPSEILHAQLQQELLKMNPDKDISFIKMLANDLMSVWWTLRQRRVSLFGCAAQGFLKYLSFPNGLHLEKHSCKKSHTDITKQCREDWTLKSTLYVLHILLNYGVELEETLKQSLMAVSPLPWQAIIPQLFARLSSHPEQKIRKQLEALLITLAKLSPWAIVYPTLVDISANEGEPSEELHHILDCLAKVHPKLVKDVDLIISELGKITVLWEEQWLSTLQDLHADVMRRIGTLKEEIARVSENSTLTHGEKVKINAAKYSAMMAPIVVSLERRLASTSRPAETDHEAWFQREYGEQLKAAIENFKKPPATVSALADAWKPFDAIAASLANYQKKSVVYLHDVAPNLAALASSNAPMPGLEKQILSESDRATDGDFQGLVTISSFSEHLTILGTKTKPKKLDLLGSDGQRYTYLLKGREDLRLDARIMQLLHAIDGMLHVNSKTQGRSLAVRYYSVTPISGRAGLIQWVENIVSIYAVYKAWQQRLQIAQFSSNGNGNAATSSAIPPVPRPTDMFYGKIIPALKEKGLRKVISRRDWPQEVKRKVLLDLMKETPRQLLYREIWCASEGFKTFRLKLQRFSGSVAVMSMVGHVLGLGDRHLDNILIDFNTGDVVHIDYNVCFDKGLRLKIPEIVPFRLTQVMQAALGLTGMEGSFRANCEAVIDTLRTNKDIILMLLEAFLWDPLVDWMCGDGHDEATIGGEERKGMELAVSLSLFASRVQEIRVPLQEHHDLLLATLPSSLAALQHLTEVLECYERISTTLIHAEQERTKCAIAETSAKSIMAEAAQNLEKVRLTYEVQAHEFNQAKAVAVEAAQKASLWVEQHSRILDALRCGSAPELQVIGHFSNMAESLSLTAAVSASGVPLTVVPEPTLAHCRDIDREIAYLTKDCYDAIVHAAKALQTYSLALQRLLPGNYIASSQVNSWAQILQLSVRQLSVEALSIARRQGAELMAKVQGEHADTIIQKYETLQIKIRKLQTDIRNLQKDSTELEASIESDNEFKAKDHLLVNFTKHLQPSKQTLKDRDSFSQSLFQDKSVEVKDNDSSPTEDEEKKFKVLTILHGASAALYDDMKEKLAGICDSITERVIMGPRVEFNCQNQQSCLLDLEEIVERCTLIADIVNEVHLMTRKSMIPRASGWYQMAVSVDDNWASNFQGCLVAIRGLMSQIVGCAIPEAVNSLISHSQAIMEAFGSLSQIRGMVETVVEELTELETQRSSLEELKRSYHKKVEDLSTHKTSLEVALEKGRDHLSWEEAEELASQVEACRMQLDKLNISWDQRDAHVSALAKKEVTAQGTLIAAEQRFNSLITNVKEGDMHATHGKHLLAEFARAFSGLEAFDKKFPACGFDSSNRNLNNIPDNTSFGISGFYPAWKISRMLKEHTFFVWKVGIIDASLDSCIRNMVLPSDHAFGFDKTLVGQKRKIEVLIEHYVDQYLMERFCPLLVESLGKESDSLKLICSEGKESEVHLSRKEIDSMKRTQSLLVEYCNAHETARAARAAVSSMKSQVQELSQDLRNTNLEAEQLKWLHDRILSSSDQSTLHTDSGLIEDVSSTNIIKLNRRTVLDDIRSAMNAITRAAEGLQNIERNSVSTEEQLERAMGWACAGSNTGGSNSSSRSTGIPPEFHEHLDHRRQLLWARQEQATNMLKLCAAVLEFEESRDGFLRTSSDVTTLGTQNEGKAWQQSYMNIISRLDISYRAFTCADHEWHLAQKNMEVASANVSNIANDLCLATMKVKSSSGELHATLSNLQDLIAKATSEVSAFCKVTRGNSALTTETGSMLEEVLAITEGAEGAHDVYKLSKEAAAQHNVLMIKLNKVNVLLLPLESMLVSSMNAVHSLMNGDEEVKLEITLGQSQALVQAIYLRLQEVCPILTDVVPMLMTAIKDLHGTLTILARTASLDAGVLHKALEIVGESQEARSQDIDLTRPEIDESDGLSVENSGDVLEAVLDHDESRNLMDGELVLQNDAESWISPPDSFWSNSDAASSSSQCEESLTNTFDIDGENAKLNGAAHSVDGVYSGKQEIPYSSEFLPSHTEDDPIIVKPDIRHDDAELILGESQTAETAINDAETNASNIPEKHPSAMVLLSEAKQKESEPSKVKDRNGNFSDLCVDQKCRLLKGKNIYASSVLKRVEAKLSGREVDANRQASVSEQVDYLLRQATSIDNLCNMYEGWTPWI